MFHLIRSLQHKPEAVRRRVAFVIAVVVTLIIAIIWFSTLSVRVDSNRREQSNTTVTPFSTIRESFGEIFRDAGEQFGTLEKQFEELNTGGTVATTSSDIGTTSSSEEVATSSSNQSQAPTTEDLPSAE